MRPLLLLGALLCVLAAAPCGAAPGGPRRRGGKPCGARIWAPHTVDITDAARPGANVLEVRVANLANNSYGDLRPSGLIGPVSVRVTVP